MEDATGMTETEKAYLAGLIDGEGTITLTRRNSGQLPQPQVSIANNNLELLIWVKKVIGSGSISTKKPKSSSHNIAYAWQVATAGPCLRLLDEIRPYLVVKKQQADLLLTRYKAVTPRNGRYTQTELDGKMQLVEVIRALNKRGQSMSSIIRQAPAAIGLQGEEIVHSAEKSVGQCPATSTI